MEKVTITIEGTAEEVAGALRRLVGAAHQEGSYVSWLPDEVEGLFNSLQPNAQRILREIATRPQGYDRNQLLTNIGVTGRGLAGRLSSIGHNKNRDYPMKRNPIELDDETGEYRMLPEFARWIQSHPSTP